MYELLKTLPTRRFVVEQIPAATFSLVVAELFYKFHSFLLECGAFLITWFVVDAAGNLLRRLFRARNVGSAKPG